MSEIPFFKTIMGHKFYERDVPELVRQLSRLNANLERIAKALEQGATAVAQDLPSR